MDFPPVPGEAFTQPLLQNQHRNSWLTVTASEVTTLEHKVRNNTVECRSGVSETILASGKLAEVPSGLWHNIVVQLEDDTAGRLVVDADVELQIGRVSG